LCLPSVTVTPSCSPHTYTSLFSSQSLLYTLSPETWSQHTNLHVSVTTLPLLKTFCYKAEDYRPFHGLHLLLQPTYHPSLLAANTFQLLPLPLPWS
jgi:hypothetical protein